MSAHKKNSRSSAIATAMRNWLATPTMLMSVAGVIAACGMGPFLPAILPDLQALAEYHVPLDQVQISPPNEWVPQNFMADVVANSELPQEVSLLRPELAKTLAEAFGNHPWVREVKSIRITGQRTIVADLEYRLPVAFIKTSEGLYAVDVDGVLLPPDSFTAADFDLLPHVENIASLPPGIPGQRWSDPLVHHALQVAQTLTPDADLQRYWKHFDLKSIIAPQPATPDEALPHRLTFELATNSGSRIIWGHPPSGDDLEPTVAQKLGRMDQYLQQFGGFNKPQGPYRIDIRHFDAISLQPLDERRYH